VQTDEILPKINLLKQYYITTQAGTCLLPRVNCDVAAVMWRVPPPNSSISFEVSAIFPLREIGDIFVYGNHPDFEV